MKYCKAHAASDVASKSCIRSIACIEFPTPLGRLRDFGEHCLLLLPMVGFSGNVVNILKTVYRRKRTIKISIIISQDWQLRRPAERALVSVVRVQPVKSRHVECAVRCRNITSSHRVNPQWQPASHWLSLAGGFSYLTTDVLRPLLSRPHSLWIGVRCSAHLSHAAMHPVRDSPWDLSLRLGSFGTVVSALCPSK